MRGKSGVMRGGRGEWGVGCSCGGFRVMNSASLPADEDIMAPSCPPFLSSPPVYSVPPVPSASFSFLLSSCPFFSLPSSFPPFHNFYVSDSSKVSSFLFFSLFSSIIVLFYWPSLPLFLVCASWLLSSFFYFFFPVYHILVSSLPCCLSLFLPVSFPLFLSIIVFLSSLLFVFLSLLSSFRFFGLPLYFFYCLLFLALSSCLFSSFSSSFFLPIFISRLLFSLLCASMFPFPALLSSSFTFFPFYLSHSLLFLGLSLSSLLCLAVSSPRFPPLSLPSFLPFHCLLFLDSLPIHFPLCLPVCFPFFFFSCLHFCFFCLCLDLIIPLLLLLFLSSPSFSLYF